MYTIKKSFSFDYSHRLHLMPENHKCKNIHGHTATASFIIADNNLNESGMVLDFNDFSFMKKWIDKNIDHSVIISLEDKDLSNFCYKQGSRMFILKEGKQSTSEIIAKVLLDIFLEGLNKMGMIFMNVSVEFCETPFSKVSFKY